MKINILYIIWSLEVGGAENIVISLAKYINKEKYNPIVCCLNYKGKLSEELEKIDIKVIALDKKPNIDLSIITKLIRILKEHKIHIVHTHLWTADFWGRIAAWMAKTPVIISTVHSVDSWKPKLFILADRVLSLFTGRIIAVSQEVRDFYINRVKIGSQKIVVIHNGVELEKFKKDTSMKNIIMEEFKLKDDEKVIGIIGRLVDLKGHTFFLEMLDILKSKYPRIKGLIIGDGPLKEKLVSKTRELNLTDNVIFTGLRNDIPGLLNLIDILVSSSICEGLSTVILEAMCIGVPVVATRVGGNRELIENERSGFLVAPRDPIALAEKVSVLLENANLYKEFVKLGRQKIKENYNVSTMVTRIESIYDELLNKKRRLKNKIKVALVIDQLDMGGAERQFVELAKNIDKNKFEVVIVVLSKNRVDLLKELTELNIDVILIDQWGKICISAFFGLFKLLKIEKPDILHTYLFTASLYGRIVAKLIGIPIVIVSERSTDIWKKSSYVWMDRLLAKVTDKILVNAETIKESLVKRERIPDKKIQIIYNGLDLNKFDLARSERNQIRKNLGVLNGNLVIGILGRLSREKDHSTFLNAAKKIISTVPHVNFLIVGDGNLREKLEGISVTLGLNKKVIFAGKINNVSNILQAMDVLVSTSIYEGCSNAILEAMAAGLPVVATKVGGNTEIVRDGITGILIPSQDPDELARAVLSLLNNSELMKSMGNKGRERIETDFLLSNMVKNTEEVYETLINQK